MALLRGAANKGKRADPASLRAMADAVIAGGMAPFELAAPVVAMVRTLPPNTNSMHHLEVPPLDVHQEGKARMAGRALLTATGKAPR
jgi:hypothetical protein